MNQGQDDRNPVDVDTGVLHLADAFDRFLEIGDEEGAVKTLEDALDEIVRTASAETLLGYTDRITEERLRQSNKLLFATGWARYYQGHWPEAVRMLEQAASLSRQQKDLSIYANASYFLMALAYYREDYAAVLDKAREAESFLGKDSPFLLGLRLLQACALMYRNRPVEAGDIWNRLKTHPLVLQDLALGMRLLIVKAAHYDFPMGRFESAEAALESALARLGRADFQMLYAQVLGFMGHLRFETGDFQEAERLFEASVHEMRKKGNPLFINVVYTVLALIGLCRGELSKARQAIGHAEACLAGTGTPRLWRENDLAAARALAALQEDRPDTFIWEAAKAVRHTEARENWWDLFQIFCLLAPAYAEAGRPDEALRLLYQSLNAVQTIGTPYGEARTRLLLASVFLDLGQPIKAEFHLLAALTLSKIHHYDFLFQKREKGHARKLLPLALNHPSHFSYAAFLLHRGWQGGQETILSHIGDTEDDLKLEAVRAVADLGIRKGEKALVSLAAGAASPIRQAAELALERIRSLPPLPLKVSCLGRFHVVQGERIISGRDWRRKAAKGLFKFFIFHSGRDILIEQLLDRFFQDKDPDKARTLFHQTVSSLRTTLEPGISPRRSSAYLRATDHAYRFDLPEGSFVDALEFEKQCIQARELLDAGNRTEGLGILKSALDLYKGDFLEEDVFEDWSGPLREKYTRWYIQCLSLLAEEHLHDHAYDLSARYAQLVLSREPWDENATLVLMKSLIASNERARAVRAYLRCCKALQEELEMAPGEPLNAFYQKIKGAAVPRPRRL